MHTNLWFFLNLNISGGSLIFPNPLRAFFYIKNCLHPGNYLQKLESPIALLICNIVSIIFLSLFSSCKAESWIFTTSYSPAVSVSPQVSLPCCKGHVLMIQVTSEYIKEKNEKAIIPLMKWTREVLGRKSIRLWLVVLLSLALPILPPNICQYPNWSLVDPGTQACRCYLAWNTTKSHIQKLLCIKYAVLF
jgi:hypothetical protein